MADFEEKTPDKESIKQIEADNEKEWIKGLKAKNKGFLVENLSFVERESIAEWIEKRRQESIGEHNELEDNIDEYDEVYRMERKEVIGSDGTLPNYRSPMTTVAMEVVHGKLMNTFFTPKDIATVLPTEEGDIPKVRKLNTFMNWSAKNELDMFTSIDRLFHYSEKVGEAPYMLTWVKEYKTKVDRKPIPDPQDTSRNLVDPDTMETLFQEVEEEKLVYNAPKLEPFSRKDYFQPKSALMDKIPEWEMRRVRITYDEYLREELAGRMYAGSINDIDDWSTETADTSKVDYEGRQIPTGKWEKEFIEFYGRIRIKVVKDDAEDELEDVQELEDEYIAIIEPQSGVLCQLRKNKFPLKERSIGIDYFIPDDDGRRKGIGMVEFMENMQKAYDVLFNQFIFGTTQSNNPFGFFQPTGNQRDEPLKIKNGYLYPTSDPNSINIVQLPAPDQSISFMMELINQWAQLLFGISDFAAGTESKVDTDAPAKKVEIIVAQGNVRMNNIIKRKNKTIKDILRRWFLLYQANMPPNKFMRIIGEDSDNPFEFKAITLDDFALKGLPDFELTGNILNSNKTLEANKRIAIFQLLTAPIGGQPNPFYNSVTPQGVQGLHQLVKWLIDGLEETGLSSFLPDPPGENVQTPEEENARFIQGDSGEPTPGEDHINHARVHNQLITDPTLPDELKQMVAEHIQKHIQMAQQELQQKLILAQQGIQPGAGGPGRGGSSGAAAGGAAGAAAAGAAGANDGPNGGPF